MTKELCRYVTLRDVNDEPRVIVCLLNNGKETLPSFGVAIRSDDDDNDFSRGKKLAYRRAKRISKFRGQCFMQREEVFYNVWNLKFPDFFAFMRLVTDCPKMDFWYKHDNFKNQATEKMYQKLDTASKNNMIYDAMVKLFDGRGDYN
jgi:hypothetical protein